jgi:MFS family permease
MTQVMLLQSIYSLAIIILELPTGALADYFGKRISLIWGSFFWTVGFFVYSLSTNFWQFMVGELILAIGTAFVSGANTAFLHENLKARNQEKNFKKVEGNCQGIIQVARVIGNAAGGAIASISLATSIFVSGIAHFFGLIVTSTFEKTKEKLAREENTEYLQLIKDSVKIIHRNPQILWLTIFYTFFNSIIFANNFLAQPYIKKVGVPIIYFGIIFASFNIINGIISAFTDKYAKLLGNKKLLGLVVIASTSLLLLGFVPILIILPVWGILMGVMTMSRTLVSDQVLKQVPSNRASTILSFQNLTRRIVYAALGPMIGFISDQWGIFWALRVSSILFALTFLLLKWWRVKAVA